MTLVKTVRQILFGVRGDYCNKLLGSLQWVFAAGKRNHVQFRIKGQVGIYGQGDKWIISFQWMDTY